MTQAEIIGYNDLIMNQQRIAPNQLYSDAVTTLPMLSVCGLGPLTMEQMAALPFPLPFRESVMIVWPQVSGLLAFTTDCFALAYFLFMRREIRS